MRVFDELIGVAVAGDDDDVVAAVAALRGERGQDVVGFETGDLDHRHAQRLEHLAHEAHLLLQNVGRGFAAGFVVVDHAVPERRLRAVEGHDHAVGLVLPHDVGEHLRETQHRVGHLPGGGGQVGRQGEESAIDERIPVEQHEATHRPQTTLRV